MTYTSVRDIFYRGKKPGLLAFVAPHGCGAEAFFEAFPQIPADPQMQAVWPLFESYIEIERDVASVELAHALARRLAYRLDISCVVLEVNYPRAIIDGGRLLDNCLRPCLPQALFASLRADFLAIHEQTLTYMDALYEKLKASPVGFLIDVHTMASFCPADPKTGRGTFPVSFPRLEDYVDQFLNAREHNFLRTLDLITEDEKGHRVADPILTKTISAALRSAGYAFAENEPYTACSNFLSYRHMTRSRAISIDVPKHFVASWREDLSDYVLSSVSIDAAKLDRLADCLAKGIGEAVDQA
jgi:hypothetical protein